MFLFPQFFASIIFLGIFFGSSFSAAPVLTTTSDWGLVGPQAFSSGSITDSTIDVASNGDVYVAFKDGSQSSKATVMKYSSGSWSIVGSAGFSSGNAGAASTQNYWVK